MHDGCIPRADEPNPSPVQAGEEGAFRELLLAAVARLPSAVFAASLSEE